jgi:hypothetical protein
MAQAQGCAEIRFARGAFSGEVTGVAQPDGIVCYTVGVGDGQTARVRVIGNNGMAFNIPGVAENQDDVRFVTRRGTYRIDVYQTFRAVRAEPFRLFVEIR